MNKRNWFIPVLIVAVNALAILVKWVLPAAVVGFVVCAVKARKCLKACPPQK